MAENRFSKGVKAAKERTAELEANKKKQEQEVAQNKIEELSFKSLSFKNLF